VSIKSLYNFKTLLKRLDFFLWDYVKDIVYRRKVWDITNLKEMITDVIATIDKGTTNGAHMEVY
jgi:hypothetical protein